MGRHFPGELLAVIDPAALPPGRRCVGVPEPRRVRIEVSAPGNLNRTSLLGGCDRDGHERAATLRTSSDCVIWSQTR